MKVPFVNLLPQYLKLQNQIDTEMNSLISKTSFIGGVAVKEFEDVLAKEEQRDYAVGLKSGTSALILALKVLQLPQGSEVITTTLTAVPTVEAIVQAGLKPVLCDVDINTAQISLDSVKSSINANTKVILPVHLYGTPAPIRELDEICRQKNLILIEDVAQAQGAFCGGRRVGSWGLISCFSFFPSKCLGGFGDSGAITTNDKSLAEKIKAISNHGRTEKYVHSTVGVNDRIDSIQAAVLKVKLPFLKLWNEMRNSVAMRYLEGLKNTPALILPSFPEDTIPSWHLFVVRNSQRDLMSKFLNETGIGTGLHYPIPVHLHPAYEFLSYEKGSFPIAENFGDQVLSLPMYPYMEDDEVAYVLDMVNEFCHLDKSS
ncbi:MAG: DegT/DnrJ/EryC1/StrS family aminotransferase [Nitrospinota bacterium]|nr:DegT/DnrJ/EryC1/StrS family aminotransferase [Nitrospinota bacterium]